MLLLKNLLFTLIVPGTVTVFIPWLFLLDEDVSVRWQAQQLLALVVLVSGAGLYLRCVWGFARVGGGTPAPIDAPRRLVITGPYRRVRNPMYWGVLLILLGEAVFFESVPLLRYAAFFFLLFHGFVILVEEPSLRRRFGAEYERYCEAVNRWIPGAAWEE